MSDEESYDIDSPDFDDDFPEFGSDMPGEVSDSRRPSFVPVTSFTSGVGRALTDSSTIKSVASAALPDSYSSAYDTYSDFADMADDIYDEAEKKLVPELKSLKNLTRKLVPRAEGIIPKGVLDKVTDLLGEEDDTGGRLAATNVDEDAIRNALGDIWSSASEESDVAKEARESTKDDARTEVSLAAQGATTDMILRLVNYQDNITSKYQKQSLELKYRHYFAARDLLALSQESFKNFLVQLNAISKNTMLPDARKEELSESYWDTMRQRVQGNVGESMASNIGSYITRFRSNLSKSAMDWVGNVAGQMNTLISGLSTFEEMQSQQDEMGIGGTDSPSDKAGGFAGEMAGGRIAKWFSDNLKPVLENSPTIQEGAGKLSYNIENLTSKIVDWKRSDERIETGFEPVDMLINKIADFIKEAAPEISNTASIKSDLAARAFETAPYDIITRRSIVEIIPGYLSRILQTVQEIASGGQVDRVVYDTSTEQFTTLSEAATKLSERIVSSGDVSTISNKINNFFEKFDKDKILTDSDKALMSEILIKDAGYGGEFKPDRYSKGSTYGGEASPEMLQRVKKVISKQYRKDGDKYAENTITTKISAEYNNIAKALPNAKAVLNQAQGIGERSILEATGFVTPDGKFDNQLYQQALLGERPELNVPTIDTGTPSPALSLVEPITTPPDDTISSVAMPIQQVEIDPSLMDIQSLKLNTDLERVINKPVLTEPVIKETTVEEPVVTEIVDSDAIVPSIAPAIDIMTRDIYKEAIEPSTVDVPATINIAEESPAIESSVVKLPVDYRSPVIANTPPVVSDVSNIVTLNNDRVDIPEDTIDRDDVIDKRVESSIERILKRTTDELPETTYQDALAIPESVTPVDIGRARDNITALIATNLNLASNEPSPDTDPSGGVVRILPTREAMPDIVPVTYEPEWEQEEMKMAVGSSFTPPTFNQDPTINNQINTNSSTLSSNMTRMMSGGSFTGSTASIGHSGTGGGANFTGGGAGGNIRGIYRGSGTSRIASPPIERANISDIGKGRVIDFPIGIESVGEESVPDIVNAVDAIGTVDDRAPSVNEPVIEQDKVLPKLLSLVDTTRETIVKQVDILTEANKEIGKATEETIEPLTSKLALVEPTVNKVLDDVKRLTTSDDVNIIPITREDLTKTEDITIKETYDNVIPLVNNAISEDLPVVPLEQAEESPKSILETITERTLELVPTREDIEHTIDVVADSKVVNLFKEVIENRKEETTNIEPTTTLLSNAIGNIVTELPTVVSESIHTGMTNIANTLSETISTSKSVDQQLNLLTDYVPTEDSTSNPLDKIADFTREIPDLIAATVNQNLYTELPKDDSMYSRATEAIAQQANLLKKMPETLSNIAQETSTTLSKTIESITSDTNRTDQLKQSDIYQNLATETSKIYEKIIENKSLDTITNEVSKLTDKVNTSTAFKTISDNVKKLSDHVTTELIPPQKSVSTEDTLEENISESISSTTSTIENSIKDNKLFNKLIESNVAKSISTHINNLQEDLSIGTSDTTPPLKDRIRDSRAVTSLSESIDNNLTIQKAKDKINELKQNKRTNKVGELLLDVVQRIDRPVSENVSEEGVDITQVIINEKDEKDELLGEDIRVKEDENVFEKDYVGEIDSGMSSPKETLDAIYKQISSRGVDEDLDSLNAYRRNTIELLTSINTGIISVADILNGRPITLRGIIRSAGEKIGGLASGAMGLGGRALGGARNVLGGGLDVTRGALGLVGGAIGGVLGGIRDYRVADPIVNIYKTGEDDPVLMARDIRRRVYIDQKSKKVISYVKDITGPVVDSRNKQIVISQDDYDEGLHADNSIGGLTKVGGALISGLGGMFNIAGGFYSTLFAAPRKAIEAGKSLTRYLNSLTDIYIAGDDRPVILANILRRGGYYSSTTGKPIFSISDIDGEIKDAQGNVVLTLDQLRGKLFDKEGKELDMRSFSTRLAARGVGLVTGGFRRGLGLVKSTARLTKEIATKGFETVRERAMSIAEKFSLPERLKTLADENKKAMDKVMDRMKDISAASTKLMSNAFTGFASRLDSLSGLTSSSLNVLREIYKLLDSRLEVPDTIRAGSWRARQAAQAAGGTITESVATDEVGRTVRGVPGIGPVQTVPQGYPAESANEGGMVDDMVSGAGMVIGAGLLTGAKTAAVKVGSAIAGSAAGKAIAGGATTVATGLSMPVILGVAAGAATLYSAYRGVKYFRDNRSLDEYETYRMMQYGVNIKDKDQYIAVRALENYIKGKVYYRGGAAGVNEDIDKVLDATGEPFNINRSDAGQVRNWHMWYSQRFLPVYIRYRSVTEAVGIKGLREIEITGNYKGVHKVLNETTFDNNIYSLRYTPFGDISITRYTATGINAKRDDLIKKLYKGKNEELVVDSINELPIEEEVIESETDESLEEIPEDLAKDTDIDSPDIVKQRKVLTEIEEEEEVIESEIESTGKTIENIDKLIEKERLSVKDSTRSGMDITKELVDTYKERRSYIDRNIIAYKMIKRTEDITDKTFESDLEQPKYSRAIGAIEQYRMLQYGLNPNDPWQIRHIRVFEHYITEDYINNPKKINTSEPSIVFETYRLLFPIDTNDEISKWQWLSWYHLRFTPVFFKYSTFCKYSDIKDLMDLDTLSNPTTLLNLLSSTKFSPDSENSPYQYLYSPFGNIELRITAGMIETVYKNIRSAALNTYKDFAVTDSSGNIETVSDRNRREINEYSLSTIQDTKNSQIIKNTKIGSNSIAMVDSGLEDNNDENISKGEVYFDKPIDAPVTSEYGVRVSPTERRMKMHKGVDYAAPEGTAIKASADGLMVRKYVSESYGNCVFLEHGNGLVSKYAHMSGFNDDYSEGSSIRQGDVIGYVGSTGRSTGNHLHFEVRGGSGAGDISYDPLELIGVGDLGRYGIVESGREYGMGGDEKLGGDIGTELGDGEDRGREVKTGEVISRNAMIGRESARVIEGVMMQRESEHRDEMRELKEIGGVLREALGVQVGIGKVLLEIKEMMADRGDEVIEVVTGGASGGELVGAGAGGNEAIRTEVTPPVSVRRKRRGDV